MDTKKVIDLLSKIYDLELNGIIRYTHYSLMIFGPNRLPLIDFFRAQASESLVHANLAGEHITGLDGHPPLNINNIQETHKHDIVDILNESLTHEQEAIDTYYELLKVVEDSSIYLEEYCRTMIAQEESDYIEMKKLLRDHKQK
jgi:bacterioferritin